MPVSVSWHLPQASLEGEDRYPFTFAEERSEMTQLPTPPGTYAAILGTPEPAALARAD